MIVGARAIMGLTRIQAITRLPLFSCISPTNVSAMNCTRSILLQSPTHRQERWSSTSASTKCKSIQMQPSIRTTAFWSSKPTWSRSTINTLRCLVGCTVGDFSMMWYLQSAYPELSTAVSMSVSMAAGITTSIILETTLLHLGKDHLPWKLAARTAIGMSMISMLAMEITENTVDYTLTGGVVDLGSAYFWAAAGLAMSAGFLVPLPYNYFRLRMYNKACH